jgi:hypothetical protein
MTYLMEMAIHFNVLRVIEFSIIWHGFLGVACALDYIAHTQSFVNAQFFGSHTHIVTLFNL